MSLPVSLILYPMSVLVVVSHTELATQALDSASNPALMLFFLIIKLNLKNVSLVFKLYKPI